MPTNLKQETKNDINKVPNRNTKIEFARIQEARGSNIDKPTYLLARTWYLGSSANRVPRVNFHATSGDYAAEIEIFWFSHSLGSRCPNRFNMEGVLARPIGQILISDR